MQSWMMRVPICRRRGGRERVSAGRGRRRELLVGQTDEVPRRLVEVEDVLERPALHHLGREHHGPAQLVDDARDVEVGAQARPGDGGPHAAAALGLAEVVALVVELAPEDAQRVVEVQAARQSCAREQQPAQRPEVARDRLAHARELDLDGEARDARVAVGERRRRRERGGVHLADRGGGEGAQVELVEVGAPVGAERVDEDFLGAGKRKNLVSVRSPAVGRRVGGGRFE